RVRLRTACAAASGSAAACRRRSRGRREEEAMRARGFATLLVVGLCVTGCGDEGDGDDESVEGDAVRGGALYDAWWSVVGADAPVTDHPLWAGRPDAESNTRSGADTW